MKKILVLIGLVNCFNQQIYADCNNPIMTLNRIKSRLDDIEVLSYLAGQESTVRSQISDIFFDLAEVGRCPMDSAQNRQFNELNTRAQTLLRSIPR